MSARPSAAPGGQRWRSVLVWALVLTVLALVFASYASPGLVVDLANQIWSCF